MPKLLVWGADDTFQPLRYAEQFAAETSEDPAPSVADPVRRQPGRRKHAVLAWAQACRRILDGQIDGLLASDHYGVLADLRLPDPRPRFCS